MGITQLPDPTEILGPAIQQVTTALQNYLQPNKAFQKHMQTQLAENPELVLKFADLEAKAPGTLARLGFGGLGDTISQVPESAAGELDRTTKPQQVAAGKAGIAAKTSTAELTDEENRAALEAMHKNPQLTYNAAVAQLRKPIQQGALGDQAISEGEFKNTLQQNRQSLIKTLPSLGTVDFYDQAKKFISGDKNIPVAAYMADPQASEAFSLAWKTVQDEMQREATNQLHKNSKKDTADDRLAAKRSQNAFLSWQKSGMAGTVDQWESFMYDPATQTRAADLASGKIKPQNFDDENLLDVANAAKNVGISRFNTAIVQVNSQIAGIVKKLSEGVPDTDRDRTVAELNQQLERRAQLGGPRYHAKWNDVPFWRDNLSYTDEKGNPVSSEKVESMMSDPAIDNSSMNPRAKTASERIANTDPSITEAAMAKYEAEDTSPNKEDSKSVRAELERRGVLKPKKK